MAALAAAVMAQMLAELPQESILAVAVVEIKALVAAVQEL
jgi:hypothetical protein